jgi:microcystin-dependent protein
VPDTLTTNYGFVRPEVGGSDDTWGTKNNQNWTDLDADLKTVSDSVSTLDTTLRTLIAAQIAAVNATIVASIPAGLIAQWSGTIAAIPAQWKLCDGTLGTPDLRDKFVVGASAGANAGATGGANSITLSQANLPAHNHTFSGTTSDQSADHFHAGWTDVQTANGNVYGLSQSFSTSGAADGVFSKGGAVTVAGTPTAVDNGDGGRFAFNWAHGHAVGIGGASNGHTHNYSGTTSSVGSATAIDNRPAFYAVLFLMKR